MAEGFEKEYDKKLMPGKYKELMSDQEIDALIAYLVTLKDASVQTPKPVKKS
jgi:mono/diheme cytochrome c family protein